MLPSNLSIHNIDCMEYMATCADQSFDLAVVDPPYGLGAIWQKDNKCKAHKQTGLGKKWNDAIPSKEYFQELFRISRNQIIWGGNFFTEHLPPKNSWIYWRKGLAEASNYSAGELAWTSYNHSIREVYVLWAGFCRHGRREGWHPTEKPIKLYDWIFANYVEAGMSVIDTHLGSGSSAVAAIARDCQFVGLEINQDYYRKALQRLQRSLLTPLERGSQLKPLALCV